MTNRQVALILSVIIRYIGKNLRLPLFDQADLLLKWLDGKLETYDI